MKGFSKIILWFVIVIALLFFITRTCSDDKSDLEERTGYVQDTSQLIIPIHIDITSFESVFNQQMDQQAWFYEETGVEVNRSLSISYRVKKQGRAQLYPQNGNIQLQIPLFIEIRPNIHSSLSLGLGRDMKLDAEVLLKSSVAVDMDENWELLADAETTFEIRDSPRLSIAGLQIDFEDQLQKNLQVGSEQINKQVEEQIKQAIDTRSMIEFVWEEIKEPYKIKGEDFDAWATISPLRVEASDLEALRPGEMQLTFAVRSLIDVSTGAKPFFQRNRKLPQANRVDEIEDRYSTFRFPLKVDFDTFLNYLREDEPFEFTMQGNQTFSLSNLQAKNKKGYLEVTADFESGATKGRLTLTGQPTFYEKNQTIGVDITKIQSASNNKVIDNVVNTIQRSSALKNNIEKRMAYSLSGDLANLTYQITGELKKTRFNEFASLNGYLNHIKIHDVFVQNNQLWLDAEVEAATICEVQSDK